MNKIIVLALGSDDVEMMSLKSINLLQSGKQIVLRTKICGISKYLDEKNIKYITLDDIYDSALDFDDLEDVLAKAVLNHSQTTNEDIIYAIPGNGLYDDGSVDRLNQICLSIEMIPAISYDIKNMAKSIPNGISMGISIIPASMLDRGLISPRLPLSVTSLDDEYILSDVKLLLSEIYSDEHQVILYTKDGVHNIPLFEIDRYKNIDHTSSLYVPAKAEGEKYDFYDMHQVFRKLRSPEGCPWDSKQTHESLKRFLLEETSEVLDAIDDGDMTGLMDELGDVLLQVVLHSVIAEERGDFDLYDISDNLCKKLVERHPHVFSDIVVSSSDEVKSNWDEIKKKKRKQTTETEIMRNVPRNMNALIRAQKIQERAAKVGFDFNNTFDALDKVYEEYNEVLNELKSNDIDKARAECGDLLFSVINVCRLLDILSEFTLNNTTTKFVNRFDMMEKEIIKRGLSFELINLNDMEKIWDNIKKL